MQIEICTWTPRSEKVGKKSAYGVNYNRGSRSVHAAYDSVCVYAHKNSHMRRAVKVYRALGNHSQNFTEGVIITLNKD